VTHHSGARAAKALRLAPTVLAALAAFALVGAAQTPQPELGIRITSPEPDTYAVGTVPIKAVIQPAHRSSEIARVLIYADGRLVCTLMDPARAECPWDAGPNITSHVLRVVAERVGGGRLVTSIRTKGLDLAEAVNVDIVQVTAVVSDRGRFIKGLPQSAFRILEDNVPQKISHFSAEGSPLEIVVALGPKDQVTLTAFNDNLFTLTRRETSAEQRLKAVDRLAPWGGTALYDVIIRGLQQLTRQPGRRVLVVFSDGDDRTSHATLAAVEQAVRSSDATLFMVALGRAVRSDALKTGIEELVDLSGGRALFVDRADRLDEPFAEIIEELANQYLIGYESSNPKSEGAWREIKVELPNHRHSVRARQGYRK
jgi:hypothetical protein